MSKCRIYGNKQIPGVTKMDSPHTNFDMQTGTGSTPDPIDPKVKFPNMRPLKSPPTLFTFNGCGLGMYGRRAFDQETGTYIKTRCISVVFMPLIAVDSFRVADAGGGAWYFIGEEKLGKFARLWRQYAVFSAVVLIGTLMWKSYIASPGYRAGKAAEQAQTLESDGRPLEAADVYLGLLRERIGDHDASAKAMSRLVRAEISSGDPARIVPAIKYADKHKVLPGLRGSLIPDLAGLALDAAAKCPKAADAVEILSSFDPVPTDLAKVHEALRTPLEQQYKDSPDDPEVRIRLALIREEFGEVAGALELLDPVADELGSGEGARLYGGILMESGRSVDALPHLERYATPRIAALRSTETSFQQAYENASNVALSKLNQTGGPPGFRTRYEAASEVEQNRMVDEYLTEQVGRAPAFLAARDRYQAAAAVVPSIMNLGVARLHVAQAEDDPVRRKELLKQSEEAFLAMKSVAGESEDYRFFLGQVYFWSGREAEGRKLFDELLELKQKDYPTLMELAAVYRKLGEDNDARKLLDQAFVKANTDAEKNMAIRIRSLLARDSDEKIEWLAKGVAGDPMLAIDLAQSRAEKAEETGDLALAASQYRIALAGYEKQERSSTVLNNSAILYLALYRLDGKQEDFETAATMFSDAVEMEPANSILSFNAAESLLTAAAIRVVGERLDPKLIQFSPGINLLRFLYRNESEKEEVVGRLKADPNFRKAINRFWEALLLAPKSTNYYSWGMVVFNYIDDTESLSRLLEKAREQDFDFSTERMEFDEFVSGKRDEKTRESLKGLYERVTALSAGLNDSRSQAFAQCYVASGHLGGFPIGVESASEKWITALKAADKEAPCSMLRSTMESSLEVVALEALEREDADCRKIIQANRRLADPGDILRILVRAKGDLGERVRKHPAVVEARQYAMMAEELFPRGVGLRDWLILEGLDPDSDSRLKGIVKANESERLTYLLKREIGFEGASSLLLRFWEKCLEGDEDGARELLPKLAGAGLEMPPMF